jgi:hypothetical protein
VVDAMTREFSDLEVVMLEAPEKAAGRKGDQP